MRNDIQERTGFTDYGLAGQDGTARPLTELRGDNLMVLHLSRGAANPRSTSGQTGGCLSFVSRR
jgi:hypothetical protein